MTRRNLGAILLTVLVGAAAAGAYEYISIHKSERYVPARGPAFVSTFRNAPTSLDLLLAESDGQFYAALTEDPTMSHPERFLTGHAEPAYRFGRPALPYLGWLVSFGVRGWARDGLAAAVVVSAGFAVGACGELVARHGIPRTAGLGVLLLPGSLIALRGFGPELLAIGFAASAVVRYDSKRVVSAGVLLAGAALSRESLLLVAGALAVHALVRGRHRDAGLILLIPLATLGAWWLVVHARVDAWPWQAGHDRLAWPWDGLTPAISRWRPPLDPIFAGLAAIIPLAALVRAPRSASTWVAVAHLAFALGLGIDVWRTWQSFGRPLLPLYAFGFVAFACADGRATATEPPPRTARQ